VSSSHNFLFHSSVVIHPVAVTVTCISVVCTKEKYTDKFKGDSCGGNGCRVTSRAPVTYDWVFVNDRAAPRYLGIAFLLSLPFSICWF